MIADASIQQIVTAFEVNGMTAEEISQELYPEMDVVVIKTVLQQNSTVYAQKNKEALKKGEESDINEFEFEQIKRAMKGLAFSTSNEELKYKTLKFLWNEKKGRNDAALTVAKLQALRGAPQTNIFLLQEQVKKAKQLVAASREPVLLDVPSSTTEVATA